MVTGRLRSQARAAVPRGAGAAWVRPEPQEPVGSHARHEAGHRGLQLGRRHGAGRRTRARRSVQHRGPGARGSSLAAPGTGAGGRRV